MDGGAWWATVQGVVKSRTWLSDFTFTFYFHALEKEMATHSTVLAWRIPGTGEPGGLPSMGLHRVGHDWRDLAAAAACFRWKGLLILAPPYLREELVKKRMGISSPFPNILYPFKLTLTRASSVGAVPGVSSRVQDRASRSMPPSLGIGTS